MKLFNKHRYAILVSALLLLALCLRFYNFDTRWGIGNDDSRDIAIAQESIRRGELPLVGSFSSAGPFVFGPFFYWFLIISYLLVPFVFTIPWILTGFVGVATVGVFILIGRQIAGNNFSLLLGLLAATSPQLVVRSLSLGQHTFIAFTGACAFLFLLLFLKEKRLRDAFFSGFFIGAAINFHYQGLNFIVLLPLLLFVQKKNIRFKIASVIFASLGVVVALAPLVYWDAHQNFANLRNLFDYLLIGQHRLYVPNSWKLFLSTYLPHYWSHVVGGYSLVALGTMLLTGVVMGFALLKKKLPYNLFLLVFPFTFLLILNRYYKGERSEGYQLYLLPFILIFVSYACFVFFRSDFVIKRFRLVTRIVGTGIILFLVFTNIYFLNTTSFVYQSRVALIERFVDELVEKHPDKTFSVYDYKGSFAYYNQPVSIFLHQRGLISEDGMPIGICTEKCPGKYTKIVSISGIFLADLQKQKNLKQNNAWINVNPASMYDDLIGWSKRHELTSNFFFIDYLKEKF